MTDNIDPRVAELSPAKRELLRQLAARQKAPARIQARARPARIPLTFGQRRLWLLDRYAPGMSAYNMPHALWLHGTPDVDALERAVQALVDRHESLRTAFRAEDGEPWQVIEADAPVAWRRLAAADAQAAYALAREEAARPFDLAAAPLLRATRIDVGDRHLLLLVFHHVAVDGWSLTSLLREFEELYNAHAQQRAPMLAPPALQIADVALWQQEVLGAEGLRPQLDYWREHLAGAASTLDLPSDRPRPATQSFRGALWRGEVPAALYDRLEQLARERQCTLSMVFLAGWQALLARYTGQDDIVVAMGVAGRKRVELEPVVGFFVNTLALRTRFDGDPTFDEVLKRVRDSVLGAMEHADAPLDRVLETLRLPRSASHTPLAQVMFFFQNYAAHELQLAGLGVEAVHVADVNPGGAQGDLSLFVNQHHARELMLEYSTDLYDVATIERMAGHLLVLLATAADAPQTRLAELPLLTAAERAELDAWNAATQRALPAERTLAALVGAQVQRTPDALALTFGARSLTYRELDRRANALAHELRAAGVGPGDLVGLYVDRSLEMVIGLLGIVNAGAAYVPLDPTYPAERLNYMLETAQARVLVSQRALRGTLAAERTVEVDASADIDARADAAPTGGAQPHDLAYVIFTSGSTGKPKGVEIRHESAVNLLRSVAREPGMAAGDVVCAISTLSFDIALFELVLPLTVGARILLVDRETARDAMTLKRVIEASPLTIVQATPATWRMLLDVGWRGRPGLKIISTGEALPRELAQRLLPCADALWNLYGPTETTVYSALCRVHGGDGPILVGTPVDNTSIHIVDRHLQRMPAGVPGELLIGGAGLARGYRGRPDLTAEKFIADPFSADPAARLYRTGDLALWRRDGTLEVIGRIDHQVKLRGFRIELGEIEAVLAQHPSVTQAVVHCREDRPGDKRLVAYVTGSAPDPHALREHLRAALPDYMLPAAFVVLAQFPLTPNGKVDRRALPPPEASAGSGGRGAPRTEEERALLEMWLALLPVREVGLEDDFFDLGGHSLLAAQLLARIDQAYGVELPLRALFDAPTLEQLAARVAQERARLVPDDLDALLASLEGLTDAEAHARLAGVHGAGDLCG